MAESFDSKPELQNTNRIGKQARKTKARAFFLMSPNFIGNRPGLWLENEDRLGVRKYNLTDGREGRVGFPVYLETPRFVFDKKYGRPVRDLEIFDEYWFVSDHAKNTFESVDPEGFIFHKCDVRLRDGEAGPIHWLCDVIRILDAVDEQASDIRINMNTHQGKQYNISGFAKIVFREEIVGKSHIFRMEHLQRQIVCDNDVRDACKSAGLKGIWFREALDITRNR
jgi:hypothetical protein